MRISVLFFFTFLFSCNNQEQKSDLPSKPTDDTSKIIPAIDAEKRVIELVENLEEVKSLMSEIDINSKGKNNLSIWVSDGPEVTKLKYYWVKVGEDNGENVATILNFYVDPYHDEILFYNVILDTIMELSVWRSTIYNAK